MSQVYHFCAPTKGQGLNLNGGYLPEVNLGDAVMQASLVASNEYIAAAVMEFGFDIRKVDGNYTFESNVVPLVPYANEKYYGPVTDRLRQACLAAMLLDTAQEYSIQVRCNGALIDLKMEIH